MSRPVPLADARSKPFFEGLAARRLMIQRCAACGQLQLGQERCLNCRSEALDWQAASGLGRIYSFAVMHAVFHPAFADETPYVVALVELAEGPRLLGRVRGLPPGSVRVGLAVRAAFQELEPGAMAPVFEPAQED